MVAEVGFCCSARRGAWLHQARLQRAETNKRPGAAAVRMLALRLRSDSPNSAPLQSPTVLQHRGRGGLWDCLLQRQCVSVAPGRESPGWYTAAALQPAALPAPAPLHFFHAAAVHWHVRSQLVCSFHAVQAAATLATWPSTSLLEPVACAALCRHYETCESESREKNTVRVCRPHVLPKAAPSSDCTIKGHPLSAGRQCLASSLQELRQMVAWRLQRYHQHSCHQANSTRLQSILIHCPPLPPPDLQVTITSKAQLYMKGWALRGAPMGVALNKTFIANVEPLATNPTDPVGGAHVASSSRRCRYQPAATTRCRRAYTQRAGPVLGSLMGCRGLRYVLRSDRRDRSSPSWQMEGPSRQMRQLDS